MDEGKANGSNSPSGSNSESAYRVLARKYRPSTFDDLIGQEPMVQTLTNAFKLGRIAQAYMLTGVRGVGKTTTARILARALNYETDAIQTPTIEMPDYGAHCDAIIDSRHIDVIEMDAASHTGIDDIREIVDAVKYKPAAARYKVYIIDEVHMLSKSAFNGLLKTLEEPPEHVKFIFATTEIRKVPVTVLSRCQRFDLRRIEADTMVDFLDNVSKKEPVTVEKNALSLVARASEGSVRDALSLLDQAIAHGGGTVDSEQMRDMLGLADRTRVIDLFNHIMSGRVKEALDEIKAQVDIGADPLVVLTDLADFTHLVTTAKLADGVPNGQALSDLEKEKAEEFATNLSIRVLSRAWQMLLKGIEEVQSANKPWAAADMVIVRLAYVADLPTPDEALKTLRDGTASTQTTPSPALGPGSGSGSGSGVTNSGMASPLGSTGAATQTSQIPMVDNVPSPEMSASQATQTRPRPVLATNNPDPRPIEKPLVAPEKQILRINRFEDFVALAEEHRDLAMRSALENHVRLISFENGRIEIAQTAQAPRTLANDIKTRLLDWTGAKWTVIVARDGGDDPLRVQRDEEDKQRTRDAEEDPVVAAVLKTFSGSKVVNVTFLDDETDGILEQVPENDPDDFDE
ncbi:MAG: DNA polymerase III subunit gamma/tau [Hyphomicrobiales bacterium]